MAPTHFSIDMFPKLVHLLEDMNGLTPDSPEAIFQPIRETWLTVRAIFVFLIPEEHLRIDLFARIETTPAYQNFLAEDHRRTALARCTSVNALEVPNR